LNNDGASENTTLPARTASWSEKWMKKRIQIHGSLRQLPAFLSDKKGKKVNGPKQKEVPHRMRPLYNAMP
jgi:hypothetical protein